MSMNVEDSKSPEKLFQYAVQQFKAGNNLRALNMFERSYSYGQSPECASYMGMLIALERGLVKMGIDLCQASIESQPNNSLHYLNLSKLLYNINRKNEASEMALRAKALAPEDNVELCEEVNTWLLKVGVRSRPVFPFLTRSNPINRYTGLLLKYLGIR